MRIQDIVVRIQDAIAGKRKWQEKWQAHIARVKALPQDYQIVYKEIQDYLCDDRPRRAIELARAWARGEIRMSRPARRLALPTRRPET